VLRTSYTTWQRSRAAAAAALSLRSLRTPTPHLSSERSLRTEKTASWRAQAVRTTTSTRLASMDSSSGALSVRRSYRLIAPARSAAWRTASGNVFSGPSRAARSASEASPTEIWRARRAKWCASAEGNRERSASVEGKRRMSTSSRSHPRIHLSAQHAFGGPPSSCGRSPRRAIPRISGHSRGGRATSDRSQSRRRGAADGQSELVSIPEGHRPQGKGQAAHLTLN
jgi:hypothetical protein